MCFGDVISNADLSALGLNLGCSRRLRASLPLPCGSAQLSSAPWPAPPPPRFCQPVGIEAGLMRRGFSEKSATACP